MSRIREARKKHGLTQGQLAALTGIPFRTIQNWEGGQRKCPEYVERMLLDKLESPNYKAILTGILATLEADQEQLQTSEARLYVAYLIDQIRSKIK